VNVAVVRVEPVAPAGERAVERHIAVDGGNLDTLRRHADQRDVAVGRFRDDLAARSGDLDPFVD
jgi:hypothetical protein